ncbi:hypothetical protein INR75_16040 [Zunongwangia sp. SCSIO 43204]|uniref:hypothetical protein n=1 Tax=Zunongwangia sp. SCSIO 43204 TaxID=2779359 RepID=UPI001CA9F681|nr:hypothetical protein [Zunongwangia sp. SCSIO 43204]UAB83669.1 hypothetical protein INR75_16040 [Zunongwangia sp. SCSIO 43204]
MKTVIILFLLSVSQLVSGQNYKDAMQKAMQNWQEGNVETASAIFERVAAVEQEKWLPDYYLGLVNTTAAFSTKDNKVLEAQLKKAEAALQSTLLKTEENAELLVLEALIYTVKITQNPMTNGQKYMPKVNEIYAKAEKLDPKNPRVKFEKAQFELGGAKFFGSDLTPICKEIEASIALFDEFENDTPFYPNWGKDQAVEALKSCKN